MTQFHYYGLPDTLRRARRRDDVGMSAASSATSMSTAMAFLNVAQAESTVAGIGQRLEAPRKQRGLSRQALGNAAGLTGQTVANIEVHGMIPRVDTVEMLAKALSEALSWLAFRVNSY